VKIVASAIPPVLVASLGLLLKAACLAQVSYLCGLIDHTMGRSNLDNEDSFVVVDLLSWGEAVLRTDRSNVA
jgi:hypothetical protein